MRAQALADLRSADAGYHFTPITAAHSLSAGRGVRIPTLGEVLWTFPRMPMLIEIKEPEVQSAVLRVLVTESATERCVVASERGEALDLVRESPVAHAASGDEIAALYRSSLLRLPLPRATYRLLSVPPRHRMLPVPTARFIAAARRLGCPVHVWTVNDAATASALWARGVAGIVTDYPGLIGKTR